MADSVLTGIRLPSDLKERAEKAGKERGLKLPQVMRLALAEWLARNPNSEVLMETKYLAIRPQDVATCQSLNWAWASIRPYVVASGSDEYDVRDKALGRLNWPPDAEIYIHEEG